MSPARKSSKKGRYNFLIDEAVYYEFSQLCDDMGLVRSKNLENYMRDFVKRSKEKKI